MCGISGIYAKQLSEKHKEVVQAIMVSQINRGPDFQQMISIQGQYSQALFAHNRLSIIDLSEHANQPMWDSSGRFCITYNGEIYNYLELRNELKHLNMEFKTNSDTEVILNAFACWGIKALARFQGPFAFAIFDKKTDELWLCRDRFGVRPLFYTKINNTYYFASSTPILAKKFGLKPNFNYLARGLKYLVYEDGSEMTAYQGLLSLPASSYLQLKLDSDGEISEIISSYYNLEDAVAEKAQQLPINNISSLLELLTATFERAVDLRLRSDVALGISLSSGLDSSSVAAEVRKKHAATIGFSFGHPKQKKSEGPLVAACAEFLKIPIHYIWPSADEMITGLYETIEIQDSPFSSLSIVAQYLLYKKVKACGIKVLLGGQGGDESFMGYRKFLLFWFRQLLNEKRYAATAKHLLQLLPMLGSELSSLSVYWKHRHRYLGKKGLGNALHLPEVTLEQPSYLSRLGMSGRQIQDITQTSLPTLLRYEDRNAMGNSVESRLPFLDHHLVELGISLPTAIKLRSGYGKWPLREIMDTKIPQKIRLARYKRGFDLPLASLLKAGLGQSIRNKLQNGSSIAEDFLKTSVNFSQAFSDQQFLKRQSAISEAITLLWLKGVLS